MPSPVQWTCFQRGLAQAYDEYLVPAIFGPFAHGLVAGANIAESEQILDLRAARRVWRDSQPPPSPPLGSSAST